MVYPFPFHPDLSPKQDFRITRTKKLLCNAFTELTKSKKIEDISIHELLKYVFNITVTLILQQMHAVQQLIDSSVFHRFLEVFSDELQKDIYLYLAKQKEKGYPLTLPLKEVSAYCTGGILFSLRYWVLNQDKVTPEEIKNSYKKILEKFF